MKREAIERLLRELDRMQMFAKSAISAAEGLDDKIEMNLLRESLRKARRGLLLQIHRWQDAVGYVTTTQQPKVNP